MTIKCPVCDFENSDESVQICENCGENLAETENKYQKPIRMLKEIGQKVVESAGSFPKEKLENIYTHIVELLQDVLDESKTSLEKNMENLRKELSSAKELSDEEVDFTGLIEGFHFAQSCINEGLNMALGALTGMKSFKDIKAGQNQLELAVTRVQAGLEHLEKISLLSSGIKVPEELPEMPLEIVLAMNSLEKSLECISRFTENFLPDEIRTALQELDEARWKLEQYLKRTGQIEEPKEAASMPSTDLQNSQEIQLEI